MHEIGASCHRELPVALASETRHFGSVFVHGVEVTVDCSSIDEICGVGVLVRGAGDSGTRVPRFLRDDELAAG